MLGLKHTFLLLLICLLGYSFALCPKCICDDENLISNCSDANLSVMPIYLNPSIKILKVSGNKIHNIEGALTLYENLIDLDLSSNEFKHVGRDQFTNQRKMQNLNLSDNFISTLHENSFQGLNNLQTLNLSQNALSILQNKTFMGLHSLVELDLRHNDLKQISVSAFQELSRLRILHLDHNSLQSIDPSWFSPLKNLRFLYLSDNHLIDIPSDAFKPLTALRVITLARNTLRTPFTHLAFRGSRHVDTLDLSGNSFEKIPDEALAHMSQLRKLDLSDNDLLSVGEESFKSLHLLQVLKLNNMSSLTSINGRAFFHNINLKELQIDHNHNLQPLPWGTFMNNAQLKILSVRNNAWTTLSPMQLPSHSLNVLQIEGLPLHCNCSIVWLWELYRQNVSSDSITELDEVKCATITSPPDETLASGGNAGDPLLHMAREQLICPDWSNVILIVSVSVIVIVLILVTTAIIVYKCRRYYLGRHQYGGASCIQIKDDTMIYKTSLRPYSPTSHGMTYKPVSASSDYSNTEPFYEVPKFSSKEEDPKSDSSSSKYSCNGLIGSELWETDFSSLSASPAHGYGNPSANVQRMAMVLASGTHGSPMSTSTGLSNTGSSSNASSTASSDSNRPLFYSPHHRFHQQSHQQQQHPNFLQMQHYNTQQHPNKKLFNSNTMLRNYPESPPSPAPSDPRSHVEGNKALMLHYSNMQGIEGAFRNSRYTNSPVRKANHRALPNNTGSLRGKSKGQNLYV